MGLSLRFGTGGIRAHMGPADNQLNEATIAAITQAVAAWLKGLSQAPTVAIAYDCRQNGGQFARTTAEVLAGNDIKVHLFGEPQPTPVLSFAVRHLGCTAGVVITASHNARSYNGYKVYDAHGCQATDDLTRQIQAKLEMHLPVLRMGYKRALESGLVSMLGEEVEQAYLLSAESSVLEVLGNGDGAEASSLRVLYTPLNGTGYLLAPKVLRYVGVEGLGTVAEQSELDGSFPTCPLPNPEDHDALRLGMRKCEREGFDLLLANDPDADRVGVAAMHDGRCVRLTGDEVAILLFDWICRMRVGQGKSLAGMVAYSTVVTTPLLDDIARRWGVELRRTLTGFKYIGEQLSRMEGEGCLGSFLLGMEESCGYLLGSYVRDKDGISAAAAIACMAGWHKERGRDLREALELLYGEYGWCTSGQVAVACTPDTLDAAMNRVRMEPPGQLGGLAVSAVLDYAKGVLIPRVVPREYAAGSCDIGLLPPSDLLELDLDEGAKVLVRPSGTEPKIKAYVFARGAGRGRANKVLEAVARDVEAFLNSTVASAEKAGIK